MDNIIDSIQFFDITIPTDSFYNNEDFKCLHSYIKNDDYDSALSFINKNMKNLLADELLLIVCHIDLLIAKNDFKNAKEVLRYYENLAYHSQKVEEVLAKMPSYIDEKMEQYYKSNKENEDEIIKNLSSKNKNDVFDAITKIKNGDIKNYLPLLLSLVKSHPSFNVRVITLLLLVEKKYDKPVKYFFNNKIMEVIPKELNIPFNNEFLNKYIFHLNQFIKDQTIIETMVFIASRYIISIYPTNIDIYDKSILAAIYYIAKKYISLNQNSDTKEPSQIFEVSQDIILKNALIIEDNLKNLDGM